VNLLIKRKCCLSFIFREKLEKVLDSVRAEEPNYKQEIGILIGDSKDKEALDTIVQQCKVVISAVGPYALYGMPLVDSCVRLGVDYCDLTGEPPFIKNCIDQYHKKAQETGIITSYVLHLILYRCDYY
jgi:short subunit dehydrogenase-like uncharacterized protein